MFAGKIVFALTILVLSAPALGQNLYNDIQREFADENQLQRDVRRYQHDVTTGHYLRAAVDRARIQNDEANLRFDQARVQTDLSYQTPGLVAHPQYPGYFYNPSQPAQLYYYPTSPPSQGQPPIVPPTFVGPPAPAASVGLANPVTFNVGPPLKTITVFINNPVETGVTIHFAVDGAAYHVPNGYTQRLMGTSASIVEFDRGDLFGDGRYRLSDGAYEFRYGDRGWELYKKPVNLPTPSNLSTSILPRNVAPRGLATALPATGVSPFATTSQPSVKDVVPPLPVPDSSSTTPR